MSEKAKTIFDHLSGLTDRKQPWDQLNDVDKKSFTPFMINRWLSMNVDFIELVNEVQRFTVGHLSPRDTYKLYFDLLPRQKQYNKYIKGKKSDKYNTELVELLSKHFLISEKESMEYIDLYQLVSLNTLEEIIKKYGKTDKEVRKLIKNGTN